MILSLFQSHLFQKCFPVCMYLIQNGFFVLLVIRTFLCQKLFCQHHIFQCGILREQMKGLKYHSKMKTFFSQFPFILTGSFGRIIEHLAFYGNTAAVRSLQKIQTPK